MSDIGSRIRRYRLSRYAMPHDSVRRRLRWFWLVALAWIAWTGLLSDHSFYRLWRLDQERQRTEREIEITRGNLRALDRDRRDPVAQQERAERKMRARGMARPGELVYMIRETPADSLAR